MYYGLVNGELLAACDLLFCALRPDWSEFGSQNKPSAQADDELPPPRGVRWELSEKQASCLWCQEELNNAVILSRTTRPSHENHPLHLTKHPTYSTSTPEGSGAPFMYAHDGEWTGPSFSCPTEVYGVRV